MSDISVAVARVCRQIPRSFLSHKVSFIVMCTPSIQLITNTTEYAALNTATLAALVTDSSRAKSSATTAVEKIPLAALSVDEVVRLLKEVAFVGNLEPIIRRKTVSGFVLNEIKSVSDVYDVRLPIYSVIGQRVFFRFLNECRDNGVDPSIRSASTPPATIVEAVASVASLAAANPADQLPCCEPPRLRTANVPDDLSTLGGIRDDDHSLSGIRESLMPSATTAVEKIPLAALTVDEVVRLLKEVAFVGNLEPIIRRKTVSGFVLNEIKSVSDVYDVRLPIYSVIGQRVFFRFLNECRDNGVDPSIRSASTPPATIVEAVASVASLAAANPADQLPCCEPPRLRTANVPDDLSTRAVDE